MPNPHGSFSLDLNFHFDKIEDFVAFVDLLKGIDEAALANLTAVLNASTQRLSDAESTAPKAGE